MSLTFFLDKPRMRATTLLCQVAQLMLVAPAYADEAEPSTIQGLRSAEQECVRRMRDTCEAKTEQCPSPINLAPKDRSCLRCGVTWVTGELRPLDFRRLLAAVGRRDRRPITTIHVVSAGGATVATVHTESWCSPEGSASGGKITLVKRGADWHVTSVIQWVE